MAPRAKEKGETATAIPTVKAETALVDIDTLVPHPKNTRQGDIGAIIQSIEANGVYRPLIVQRKTRHILSGNHTWQALKQLGVKRVEVRFLDVDDDRALAILLVDNRTNDLAAYDEFALLEVLKERALTGAGLAGTGFTGDDIDDLSMKLSAPPLDQVAKTDDPDGSLLWPEIRLRVPPDVKARYDAIVSEFEGEEHEKFAKMLDRLE